MWLKEMLAEKRDATQAAATCEYPGGGGGVAGDGRPSNVVNIEEAEFHCSEFTSAAMLFSCGLQCNILQDFSASVLDMKFDLAQAPELIN